MNKNNFFVKFAHFYIGNFRNIKEKIDNVRDFIVENYEDLIIMAMTPIAFVINIISIVIPIKQLVLSCLSVYLTDEEVGKLSRNKSGGYFTKASIKKRKRELAEEPVQEPPVNEGEE